MNAENKTNSLCCASACPLGEPACNRETTAGHRAYPAIQSLGVAGALLVCLGTGFPALANDARHSEQRISEGSAYSVEQMAEALSSTGLPDPFASLNAQDTQLTSRHHPVFVYQDVWITDIGTLLYADRDRDGYFAGISLSIDADTHYSDIDVYVSIELQHQSGEREQLHTSNIFTLYGNTITDEYRIDIDLVRNYPVGSYELFIQLLDASSNEQLDRVSAAEFSNLGGLPLESEDEDLVASFPDPEPAPEPVVNDDIRVVEYAGSAGLMMLAVLTLLILGRITSSTTSIGQRAVGIILGTRLNPSARQHLLETQSGNGRTRDRIPAPDHRFQTGGHAPGSTGRRWFKTR